MLKFYMKNNQIALIDDKKFLITSVLFLSKSVNLLGFYFNENKKTWNNHVSSINLTIEQYQNLKLFF